MLSRLDTVHPQSTEQGEAIHASAGTFSASLDTCDQVRKNTLNIAPDGQVVLPWTWGAHRTLPGFSKDEIQKVLSESLKACGRESESQAVLNCGKEFKVGQCNNCGSFPAFPISCDNRLCSNCASRRSEIMISGHAGVLKEIHNPKMITLTFPSVKHLNREWFKWARNCFTKLRRRKVMQSCWGGIYSFEFTYTEEYGWHPHIHALIGSGYIDQALLSKEWEQISGAKIVDIRAVKGEDKWQAIREVVKYPTKVTSFYDNPDLVNEFLTATEGIKLTVGFGALYRVQTKRHGDAKMKCPVCGYDDIDFANGAGFHVPIDGGHIQKIKGGYVWLQQGRAPPSSEISGPVPGSARTGAGEK